jgi:sugar lactone lactonase YvrE
MTRGDLFGDSDPAIVVVDLRTGAVRRTLERHPSLAPEDIVVAIDGHLLQGTNAAGEAEEPRFGLNPIAIDPASEWVYYGAFSGTSVYRVRAADLADPTLAPALLSERVERYGDKVPSDGIGVDGGGNVYVTDLGRNAIGVTEPGGAYRILIQDDRLSWPDGMALGPDGFFIR